MRIPYGAFFLIIFACAPATLAFAKTNKKILPRFLQKAYIIQKSAIIYARPDFDAIQVTSIPSGALVTISKKIYRPKQTGFGTFYRIYINKPKKLKAYISEIDVVPRYIRSGSKYKINPSFQQVKKNLSRLKDLQFNREPEKESLDFKNTPISQMKFIGLITDYIRLKHRRPQNTQSAWFFNLRLSWPGFPLPILTADAGLGFSTAKPFFDGIKSQRGYYLMGNMILKLALLESPYFLVHLGGGFALKWKQALPPDLLTSMHLTAGVTSLGSFVIRIHERFYLQLEGKLQYDFSEYGLSSGLGGGIMAAF